MHTELATFDDAFRRPDRRIECFLTLPMDLDRAALQDCLRRIGTEGS